MNPFLKSDLTFSILQLSENELSLIERLQSWDIGLAKISGASFRNLPDKLSLPATLDGFETIKIFNIISGDISKNISIFV